MRNYTDDEERTIRVRRLVDEWTRSELLAAVQHERLAADLQVDLRRTNRFLRLTLFGFGLLIAGAAVGLVGVTLDLKGEAPVGVLCFAAAVLFAGFAEFLIGRFRLYHFGVEEACAAAAVVLVAIGSGLIAASSSGIRADHYVWFVALIAGSAVAFAVYRRYGYVYAGIAAMVSLSAAAFQLDLSETFQRLLAAAVLGGCCIGARLKRRTYGDEYPGDEYGTIQAVAALGVYAVLNIHLNLAPFTRSHGASSYFHWFTYAMIWIVPAAGVWLSLRDRDRPLVDVSLLMALATLVTNKSYLGLERKPWDPIVLGLLLIGGAILLRRWLANGRDGSRRGFTATRLLGSDKNAVTVVGMASAAYNPAPAHSHADRSPDPFKGEGGRSGGGGGGASDRRLDLRPR